MHRFQKSLPPKILFLPFSMNILKYPGTSNLSVISYQISYPFCNTANKITPQDKQHIQAVTYRTQKQAAGKTPALQGG